MKKKLKNKKLNVVGNNKNKKKLKNRKLSAVIKKIKSTKRKKIVSNIIVTINVLFILGCMIFYGSRLVFYYKLEHPKTDGNLSFIDAINLKKNLVTVGSGLYKTKNGYVYKGKAENNYVKYSGRIWRIVSISEDNTIKLITDKPQTSLVWGINSNYENSYVRSWLNDENNEIKSFYDSLTDKTIVGLTNTCIDVIDEENISCDNTITDRVGLLSIYEYTEAGAEKSYLNIGEYWWLSNIDKDNTAWYVYSKGNVNNTSYSASTYFSYGVRPVITIDGSVNTFSGDGTFNNPINLDKDTPDVLNQKYVGDYITYSKYNWRIIETNDEYVKVVMDGYILEDGYPLTATFGTSNYCSLSSGMCNYLNTTFYDSLENKDYILNHQFNTGRYDKTYSYNFNKIAEYKETLNVGLLQLGELFVTDYPKYFLATRTITSDNSIYEVLDSGRIYAGDLRDEQKIRPAIYLKPDLTITFGNGSKDRPYIIE